MQTLTSNIPIFSETLKHLGQNSPMYFSSTKKRIIKPVLLTHCKLQQKQYDSKFNKAFSIRNYKYIAKFAAVGCLTDENLKKIKKSSLKIARSVEFDPYLCDASGLKTLGEVLKKLRMLIIDINLIIRRFESEKEVENVGLCLRRIRGLKRLRLELIGSSADFSSEMVTNLGKSVSKCYILEALDAKLVHLENMGQKDYVSFAISYSKLLRLEEVKNQFLSFYTPQSEFGGALNKIPKIKKVKRLLINSSAKTAWASMTDGSGQFLPALFKYFIGQANLEHYVHLLDNSEVPTEAVEELAKVLPNMSTLRTLFLEFANCRLGELELMILAEGFMNCKQIRDFTFKFTERSPLSLEVIGQFVKLISDLSFLSSFELFFGKLKYSSEEEFVLRSILSEATNVEYVLTKHSLHAYKKKVVIEE